MYDQKIRHRYPALMVSKDNYKAAYQNLVNAMAKTFPKGTHVRINHWRGSYIGVVMRTDEHRVYVINDKTKKVSHAYPSLDIRGELSVEIIK